MENVITVGKLSHQRSWKQQKHQVSILHFDYQRLGVVDLAFHYSEYKPTAWQAQLIRRLKRRQLDIEIRLQSVVKRSALVRDYIDRKKGNTQ